MARTVVVIALALWSASLVGCANDAPAGVCVCNGSVPEGTLDTPCGTRQCVGGVPYRCTGANTASREPGTCGGPAPNPRPAGTPDVMFVAVSGHSLDLGAEYNTEYLFSQGTIRELARPFLDAGLQVEAVTFTDNFYDHAGASGFLSLIATLTTMRDELVGTWDNPTRFIVVGHSHGTVWAHLALFVLEGWGIPLPVDALVDIDGISPGWEDKAFLWFGDAWAPVIRAHMAETGQTWPFDIANASDSVDIPGQPYLQDIEDVVPESVLVNYEIWSSDGTIPEPVRDSQPNHRLDGSERDIVWFRSAENHERSDDPGSDTVEWVRQELVLLYGG